MAEESSGGFLRGRGGRPPLENWNYIFETVHEHSQLEFQSEDGRNCSAIIIPGMDNDREEQGKVDLQLHKQKLIGNLPRRQGALL